MRKVDTSYKTARLPAKVTAYHCGASFRGPLSLDFVGSGEGLTVLGPGIYFHTDPEISRIYCKYGGDRPMMIRVEIDTTNVIVSTETKFRSRRMQLDLFARRSGWVRQTTEQGYRKAPGVMGWLHHTFGAERTARILIEHGLDGAAASVGPGMEICVWNLRRLREVSRIPLWAPENGYAEQVIEAFFDRHPVLRNYRDVPVEFSEQRDPWAKKDVLVVSLRALAGYDEKRPDPYGTHARVVRESDTATSDSSILDAIARYVYARVSDKLKKLAKGIRFEIPFRHGSHADDSYGEEHFVFFFVGMVRGTATSSEDDAAWHELVRRAVQSEVRFPQKPFPTA